MDRETSWKEAAKHVTFALMFKPHIGPMSNMLGEENPVMAQINLGM